MISDRYLALDAVDDVISEDIVMMKTHNLITTMAVQLESVGWQSSDVMLLAVITGLFEDGQ